MTKLSISRAWDESRLVLARDGKLIGTVALALFVLPGIVLNVVMPRTPTTEMPRPNAWMVVALVPILISLVGQLSVVRLAMGPHVSVGEAIAHGGRRLLSYVGAVLAWTIPFMIVGSVLYAVVGRDPQHPSTGAAVALLALTIVGVFIAVRLIMMSPVASAEAAGPIAVIRRSWDLTKGHWWRLFGFLVIFLVGALILLFAAQSVSTLIARIFFHDISPLSVGGLLVTIVSQLVSGAVSVLLFVMLARIYVQLTERAQAEVHVPNSGI
jgi:uncharacterized membrane protein